MDRMNEQERKELDQLLAQREIDLRASVRGLREVFATPDGGAGAPRDGAEDGDARMMATLDITHVHRLEGELRDVLEARERMRQGEYGRCEECDQAIPVARLRVRPEARFCIRHEEAWEKAHPGGGPVQA
jgi:DnaK suppressor protein